ncbi:MAG: hypothetical protein V9G29_08230 [Burkholderiaceae bacterium]
MKNGLLPARRLPGRCESTASPVTGASSVIGTITSISASTRGIERRSCWRLGAASIVNSSRPGDAASGASGSCVAA